MKMWKEKSWQWETTGVDGNTQLFGVNIFEYKWVNTGRTAKIKTSELRGEEDVPIYNL